MSGDLGSYYAPSVGLLEHQLGALALAYGVAELKILFGGKASPRAFAVRSGQTGLAVEICVQDNGNGRQLIGAGDSLVDAVRAALEKLRDNLEEDFKARRAEADSKFLTLSDVRALLTELDQ